MRGGEIENQDLYTVIEAEYEDGKNCRYGWMRKH